LACWPWSSWRQSSAQVSGAAAAVDADFAVW
jgi:hypothetical protein